MKYLKKLVGFVYYKCKKLLKPSNLNYYIISKTKSKTLSALRAKQIYTEERAAQLNNDDNLKIYDYHKAYFKQIFHQTNLPSNKSLSLVDFGCGTGRYLEVQKIYKKVYLVDISNHNLKIASEIAKKLDIEYEAIQGSLNAIKKKIDVFFSVGVFGIQYPFNKKTVRKIYSTLSSNGIAIFTVKNNDYQDHEVYQEVLALSESKILKVLEGFNFTTERVDFPSIRGDKESVVVVELRK
tara:strand:- start:1015 stop:1728 length:714 start_codon:yes stop_codon:yes gene_type:complete